MEVLKLMEIQGLAQDFLEAPRVSRRDDGLSITYDYEMESGQYGERSIYFDGVNDYRHVVESHVTLDMLKAYNSVAQVVDSEWISNEMRSRGLKHYMIYFDEYGAYEIIANEFRFSV